MPRLGPFVGSGKRPRRLSTGDGPQPVSPPAKTVAPAITGTPTQGQTLTASQGTWSNSPIDYAYQWKADGTDITDATASTYLLTAAEVGKTITVAVTASNVGGSASAASAGVGPVAAAPVAPAVTLVDATPKTGGSDGLGSYITGLSLGEPFADRWLAIGFQSYNGTGRTKAAGQGSNLNEQQFDYIIGSGSTDWPQIGLIHYPEGDTGNLWVEFDAPDRATMSFVAAISGLGAALAFVDSFADVGPNGTIDVEIGSVLIANALAWQIGAGVWSGVTEILPWQGSSSASIASLVPSVDEANHAVEYSTAINGLTMACIKAGP